MKQIPFYKSLTNTAVNVSVPNPELYQEAATLYPSTLKNLVLNNPNGTAYFLQMFDMPAAGAGPTLGTTKPNKVIEIGVNAEFTGSNPNQLYTATQSWWVAFTTTDTGSTAPASNLDFSCDCVVP